MRRRCDVCGRDGDDVRARLSEMTPEFPPRYQTLLRCQDSVACRERCEAVGETWPIATGSEDTYVPALGAPTDV